MQGAFRGIVLERVSRGERGEGKSFLNGHGRGQGMEEALASGHGRFPYGAALASRPVGVMELIALNNQGEQGAVEVNGGFLVRALRVRVAVDG